MKTKLHLGIIALAGLLLAHSSLANTVTVTNLADSGPGTLRDLIAGSAANDTILCAIPGTILLTSGELAISHNLAIVGPGATNLTINGSGASRVFDITSGTVSISSLTVSNGFTKGAAGTSESRDGVNGQGGGIYNSATLALTNCNVAQNVAVGGDGFGDNSANRLGEGGNGFGGGIFNETNGRLTVVNCQVSYNFTAGGGGAQTTNIINDPSSGPGGVGFGGGVYSSGPACLLAGCTLQNNRAYGALGNGVGFAEGGGIAVTEGSLVNCTIVTNYSVGGGPYGYPFSGVQWGAWGGGVVAGILPGTSGSTGVTINSCTISANQATGGGAMGAGLAELQNVPLTLENTIVAGNIGTSTSTDQTEESDVYGTVISSGYNLIGTKDSDTVGLIASDQVGTSVNPIDPLLGPLQDNGGPTPTMALPANSPALNKGKRFGLTTDQRGRPRPFPYPNVLWATGGDGNDIGAYERSFRLPLLNIVLKHQPYDVAEISFPPDPEFPSNPVFGLQVNTNGLNTIAGLWQDLQSPMRMIDGQFVTRDRIVQKGPGQQGSGLGTVYRGSTGVTNVSFVPNPVTLPASNLAPTTATLNGSDVPIGGNTAYWFQYGYDTGQGINYDHNSVTNTLATSSHTNIVSYSVAGLLPLTPYHCQLVVTDDWGTQYGGAQPFTTPGYPPAVVTSVATSITTTSAVLNGTVDDNGTPLSGYYEYGPAVNLPCCGTTYYFTNTPHFYGPASGIVQPFSIGVSNLNPSTTYYFYIVAFNGFGEATGVTNSFPTADPPPPTPVTQDPTYPIPCPDCAPTQVLNGTVNGNGYGFYGYFQYGLNPNNYTYDTSSFSFAGTNNSPQPFSFNMTNVTATLIHYNTYHYRIIAFSIWSGTEVDGVDKTFFYP